MKSLSAELYLGDQIPHISRDQKRARLWLVCYSIEYIVLVVAHVPHVLLVEHNFFLAPLQRRKIPAFHHPSTSSADLQHLILRVLVRKYPLVINNFELVQL